MPKDDAQSYHYNVMRRAIEAVDRLGPQASLDELAAEIGMSPAHFQRLFTRWAGVSPKRYQQYLTLGHASTPRSRADFRAAGGCTTSSCAGRR